MKIVVEVYCGKCVDGVRGQLQPMDNEDTVFINETARTKSATYRCPQCEQETLVMMRVDASSVTIVPSDVVSAVQSDQTSERPPQTFPQSKLPGGGKG